MDHYNTPQEVVFFRSLVQAIFVRNSLPWWRKPSAVFMCSRRLGKADNPGFKPFTIEQNNAINSESDATVHGLILNFRTVRKPH